MAEDSEEANELPGKIVNSEILPERNTLGDLVDELTEDYSKYLKVDVTSEKKLLEDEIEDLLTRLDEFSSLVDMVRGENALCLNTTLPEVHKKCEEMEKIFEKIDHLEDFMKILKRDLDVLEEKVTEAEQQLDSSSMKKLFTSLQKPLFSKKMEQKKQLKYEPPEIFKTEDFFPNVKSDSSIE